MGSANHLLEGNDYIEKPRFLEAITENNSPRYDWGPKKRINHYGLYAHLNALESNNDIALNGIRTKSVTGIVNRNFQTDNKDEFDVYSEQF